MSKHLKSVFLVVALITALVLAACGGGGTQSTSTDSSSSQPSGTQPAQPAPAKKKVVIGTGSPLTGPSAVDGQQIRDGVLLAVKLAQESGKLAEYEITVDPQDDKSDPKEGATIANRFNSNNDVLAVIGHYNSSVTLAAAPILTKAQIVQISPASSAPNIRGFSDFLFRTQTTDLTAAKSIGQWAQDLGIQKAATLYESSDYGKGLQEGYRQFFNGQLVAEESYLAGQTQDFTPLLTKVKDAGAQAIFLGSTYTDAALIAKQAKALNMNVVIFGNESEYTQGLIDVGKDAVEGMKVVGSYDPASQDPEFVKFWNAFKAAYNQEPNVFAAQAYDAANIVLAGLAEVGPDRAKLGQWVMDMKDFPGITGKITFDQGDVDKALLRFEVQTGKFVPVTK